jgi:cell division protein FtsN
MIATSRHQRHRFVLRLRHQRGNTLTGIIIGLIVGLAIAVAVALAITKGATPFTEKSAKASKMAEPTPGQVSDPNKPLYSSKEAAREANKQFAGKKAEAADPLGAAVAAMKDPADLKAEGKADAKAEAKPEARPEVKPELKPAALKVAEAGTSTGEDKFTYYLQAGAFREMSEAENTRAKLLLLGFDVTVSERANDSGVLHRVRVGPFTQVEAMNKARARLLENGIDVAIVRNQK